MSTVKKYFDGREFRVYKFIANNGEFVWVRFDKETGRWHESDDGFTWELISDEEATLVEDCVELSNG